MQAFVATGKEQLHEADVVDKTVERTRLRAKRLKRKLRAKGLTANGNGGSDDDVPVRVGVRAAWRRGSTRRAHVPPPPTLRYRGAAPDRRGPRPVG